MGPAADAGVGGPMRAVVLEDRGVLALRERPEPVPGPGEVLLRVRAVSVCGSDLHRYHRGHRTYPLVLGHEAAGEVVRAGPGADPGLVGRRVALIPLVPDGTCPDCVAGRFSACPAYSFIGSRVDGAFAELVALPVRNVLPLPDDLPFETGALVEPSSVARHLLDLPGGDRSNGRPDAIRDASVAVLGAGPIGLLVVRWLALLGARAILATDLVPDHLEAARSLGATAVVDPARDDVAAAVERLAPGGVDLVVEASGAPAALLSTVELARARGTILLAGNQPPESTLASAFLERLMRRELSLGGGFMSYSAPWPGREWTESVAALAAGRIPIAPLVSHRFPLSEAPAVFAAIGDGRLVHRKIVFDPTS